MSKKSVLVTGCAGFICFHLIKSLLEDGVDVYGVDNLDPFYSIDAKQKNLSDLAAIAKENKVQFKFQKMDINDLSVNFLKDISLEAVIHLAAKAGVRPSIEDPVGYYKANVAGTLHVLEFCRQRKITDLVFGSSSSVYGNSTPVPFKEDADCSQPISPYAATKRAGELLCYTYSKLYQMRIASLRFFTVYGPRQRPDLAIHKFTKLIYKEGSVPFFGDGSTSRDYTHVSDIISGILSAKQWTKTSQFGSFEIFNLGGSHPISLKHLVETIEKNLHKKAKLNQQPMQPGDVERTYADLEKSHQMLKYQPKIIIEAGIADFVQWFLKDQEERQQDQKLKAA